MDALHETKGRNVLMPPQHWTTVLWQLTKTKKQKLDLHHKLLKRWLYITPSGVKCNHDVIYVLILYTNVFVML